MLRLIASPFTRHGPANRWDALKSLALALMLLDHVAFSFFPDQAWLRALGRGAAPLFFFLVGFARPSRSSYDALICAVALLGLNTWLSGWPLPLNILFTLLAGRLMVRALDAGRIPLQHPVEWAIVLLMLVPTVLLAQGGSIGLIFVLLGYMTRTRRFSEREWLLTALIGFSAFGAMEAAALHFTPGPTWLTALTLMGVARLCWHFTPAPLNDTGTARWAAPVMKLLGRYSLWIYTLHFAALQLITGKYY